MKNIFLTKQWLECLTQNSTSSKIITIDYNNEKICLLKWQKFIFEKWSIYGQIESDQLQYVLRKAKQQGVFLVESNFNMTRWTSKEFLEHQQLTITNLNSTFGTYVVDLTLAEEELWNKIHSKHKNVIRKAIKLGVEIHFSLNIDLFKEILDKVYEKGGKNNYFTHNYLTSLLKLDNKIIFAGAYYDNKLQSGIIVPFDQNCGYYLHGATISESKLGAANLLQWEVIKKLKSLGVKIYDLGGARKQTNDQRLRGIFRFKERFGGQFIDCFFWEKILNYPKYKLFKLINFFSTRR